MAKNLSIKERNAASSFFPKEPTEPTFATEATFTTTATEGKKNDRSGKRFNLSLYSPDTLRDIRILAAAQGVSVNELINIILTDYIAAHAEGVSRCKEIFSK